MKLAIAGDSAGLPLVATLLPHLRARAGLEVCDLSQAPDGTKEFYANLAERVALAVRSGEYDRGILICGTGIGMAISANKVPGIRAAQAHDTYSAERASKSNDAHIITIGARVVGIELAKAIVAAFIGSSFEPRSQSKLDALAAHEQRLRGGC